MNYICKCKKTNFLKKEYTYWEDREVTTDELDIINLLKKSNSFNYKSILHIGIGNSYLYECDGEIGDYGEEFIYTLYPKEGEETYISIYNVWQKECIFVGTADELIKKYKLKNND